MTSPSQEAVGRQREAALPGASSWVSASAGTGKTTVLTNRMLRLLLDGARPEMLLAITFTRAAAAEMENRLFHRLGRWAGMEDGPLAEDLERLTGERPPAETLAEARKLLARALECPGGMRIQTIHSFCQSLLASFPLEAGLAPHFRLLDETEARALRREARAEALGEAAGDDGALGDALATAVRFSSEMNLHQTLESLTADGVRLSGAVRRAGDIDAYVERIAKALGAEPGDSEREAVAGALRGAKARKEGLVRAAAALERGSNADRERAAAILSWLDLDEAAPGLQDAWDGWRGAFLTKDGAPRKTLATKAAKESDPGAAASLEEEAGHVQDCLERMKRARVFETSAAFARLGAEEARRYGRLKRSRVAVDYNDLIERAGRLLTRREASDWILYKLDGGVDHILVDEAQDTSPAQWRVIDALAREFFAGKGSHDGFTRTVFAVGDSKQSIFRFQGADPASFARMRSRFQERATDAQLDWRPVSLDISFRSTRAVLEAVDAVANEAGPGLAEEGEDIAHVAYREAAPGRVEVWPPVAPEEEGSLPNAAVERLATLMAERIKEMTDPSGAEGAPAVSPGEIMVLVRKRNPFMPYIARALRRLGVPVAGLDRMDLAAQPAAIDLINLGRFLLLPQDDLMLANVLKGPLAGLERGISEEGLFDLAHGREKKSLWSELQRRRGEREEYGHAAARLLRLLERAEELPPFELFSEALDGPGGARTTLLARLGADAAEAVEEFLVQALDHGRREVPSLEGFLAWLDRERIEVKRDMEAVGSSVRIMTVHGAKGLEAPVVFVADRAGKPRFPSQVVWGKGDTAIRIHSKSERDPVSNRLVDEQEERDWEEYRRLLYVAMTRARDRLVVASWWAKPTESAEHWPAMVRGPLSRAPGVEADGSFPLDGGDLPCLVLDRPGTERPEPSARHSEETAELPSWIAEAARRERTRGRAAPSGGGSRAHDPEAAARGTFAHLLLERLADVAPGEREARAKPLGRRLGKGLPEATRDEATEKVLAVLANPAFATVFGPGSRGEVEIAGRIDGTDVQGSIDRLVVGEREVLAVEFKSGRPASSWADAPVAHRRQLSSYLALLEGTYPGRAVRGALLYLERPELLEAASASKASPT